MIDILVRFFGLGWQSFKANGWNIFDVVVAGGSFITSLVVTFGTTNFSIEQLQKLFLVSIAFKLVQRTNSLNTLFKTAMYVYLFSAHFLFVTVPQGQPTSHCQPFVFVANIVYLLCNPLRGGVQLNKMEYG